MTNECDALREEIAILSAENRHLLNTINTLRNTPRYPEAAIQAVWEHGNEAAHVLGAIHYDHHAEEVTRIFIEALQGA